MAWLFVACTRGTYARLSSNRPVVSTLQYRLFLTFIITSSCKNRMVAQRVFRLTQAIGIWQRFLHFQAICSKNSLRNALCVKGCHQVMRQIQDLGSLVKAAPASIM